MSATRLSLFAVTAPGLEPLARAELEEVGIAGREEPGGVAWEGTRREMYEANLRSRLATRVLVRLASFRARSFAELEGHARRIPWELRVPAGDPVRLRVTAGRSRLYHEGAIAERVWAAIAARVPGVRPAPARSGEEDDDRAAGSLLVVRMDQDRCTVSADSSGELLHRRGYRPAVGRAPLRETLAAALLRAAGWDGASALLDPFCGSGTIPIEAALRARRIAPGLATAERTPRRYAFERWPDFARAEWEEEVERARGEIRATSPAPIAGSDRDAGAVESAIANAERAGVAEDLRIERVPISAVEPPPGPGWVVTNPPYGVRVGEREGLRDLYAAFGRLARERLGGWTLALLSADPRLAGQVGVRWEEALRTRNGGLVVRALVGRA